VRNAIFRYHILMEQWQKEKAPISKEDLIACISATDFYWRDAEDLVEKIREKQFDCIAVSSAGVPDMEVSAETGIVAKHRVLHCGHAIEKAVTLLCGEGHLIPRDLPHSIRIEEK